MNTYTKLYMTIKTIGLGLATVVAAVASLGLGHPLEIEFDHTLIPGKFDKPGQLYDDNGHKWDDTFGQLERTNSSNESNNTTSNEPTGTGNQTEHSASDRE